MAMTRERAMTRGRRRDGGHGTIKMIAMMMTMTMMMMIEMMMMMRGVRAQGGWDASSSSREMREEEEGASSSSWVEIDVAEGVARTPRSYEAPAYAYDANAGRARFRGWFHLTTTVEAGRDVLAKPLPEEVRPVKDEMWKMTMKGAERELTVTTDGAFLLADEYHADTWFTLRGLEYDTAAAFASDDDDANDETCDASTGSCGA